MQLSKKSGSLFQLPYMMKISVTCRTEFYAGGGADHGSARISGKISAEWFYKK